FVLLALLQVLAAGFFDWRQEGTSFRFPVSVGRISVAVVVGLVAQNFDPHALIQQVSSNGQPASQVIENKYGIITVFPPADLQKHEPGDDAVYGRNVYDGRTNLSLIKNTNGLD